MGSNPISSDLFLRVVRILAAQPRLRLASLMQGALVFAHQCKSFPSIRFVWGRVTYSKQLQRGAKCDNVTLGSPLILRVMWHSSVLS